MHYSHAGWPNSSCSLTRNRYRMYWLSTLPDPADQAHERIWFYSPCTCIPNAIILSDIPEWYCTAWLMVVLHWRAGGQITIQKQYQDYRYRIYVFTICRYGQASQSLVLLIANVSARCLAVFCWGWGLAKKITNRSWSACKYCKVLAEVSTNIVAKAKNVSIRLGSTAGCSAFAPACNL